MIDENIKNIIIKYSKKYGVSKVIIFGSSIENDDANDIDIAVSGIDPLLFFKFYGELIRELPKAVDLVDLSDNSMFNDIIEETGIVIYG